MSTTRKLTKGVALLLMLALVLSVFPMTARADNPTCHLTNGAGTAASPYTISSTNELSTFASDLASGYSYSGKYVELTADLATVTTVLAPNSDTLFAGTFNGGGKTITVDLSGGARTALFGYVSGTIKNLTVDGEVDATGSNSGGIVGYLIGGQVENCINKASVNGTSNAGGVVGNLNGGNVINCANEGDIDASGGYSGGVVGYTGGTCTIDGCYNIGAISGGTRIGGVVGEQYYDVTVSNCYNMGSVTGTSTCNGGVVGYSRNAVTNCYHAVGIISTSYNGGSKGAIIGLMLSGSGSMANCYYVETSTGLQASNSGDSGATKNTVADMKTSAIPLGSYYMDDVTPNLNGGYPILYWQGGGSAPDPTIVNNLNTLVNSTSDLQILDSLMMSIPSGSDVYDDYIELTTCSGTIQVNGNSVNVGTVWTSSNSNAVTVPATGNGIATVTHSANGDVSVTLTAYLTVLVNGVTYTSSSGRSFALNITRDAGPIVTYTVYVSVFNTNRNSPTVTGNNSRLMVAARVTVTGHANTICVDDALQQLHAEYYSGGSTGYATSNGMITKLWGITNNNAFGIYRNNVLTNAVTQEPIQSGDMITVFAYMNTSSYNDKYLYFNSATLITSPTDSKSLPAYYKTYSSQSGTSTSISNTTIYKLNTDGTLSSASNISYSNGTLSTSGAAEGMYVLYGAINTYIIGARYVPAVTRIIVTSNSGSIANEIDALSIDNAIESYIDLPTTGANGSTISWSSNPQSTVILNNGLVIRPIGSTGSIETLKATFNNNSNTTKSFNIAVAPQIDGSDYDDVMGGLATKVSNMLSDEASFRNNMWILLDIVRRSGIPNATDKAMYHGYLESYIADTNYGVASELISVAQGSSNMAKAVILLKAMGYNTSNDTLYSAAMSNMQTYANSVLTYLNGQNASQDERIDYLSTASFVLMAILQENQSDYATLRDTIQVFLTSNQTSSGNWSTYIDIDAVVITGLSMYKKVIPSNTTVNTAITNGVTYLSGQQLANGSFGLESSSVIGNANSTAFVLIGLIAAGYDPEYVATGGRDVLDGIMMYYYNGDFQYNGLPNDLATEQCFRALLAEDVFATNGVSYVIYDFR